MSAPLAAPGAGAGDGCSAGSGSEPLRPSRRGRGRRRGLRHLPRFRPEGHGPPATRADLDETVRLVRETGRRAIGIEGDVRSAADLQAAVDAAVSEFGGLHVVVANAGVLGGGRLAAELDEEDWDLTLDVNLKGVWLTARAALPALVASGGGSIVLIGSAARLKGVQHLVDYCAAKAGVVALTKVLALQHGRHGVRVNCVCPGNVATDLVINPTVMSFFRPDLPDPGFADVAPLFAQMNVLEGKPLLDPLDVSEAVAWLAGDGSRWVTGVVLPVDQGMGLR